MIKWRYTTLKKYKCPSRCNNTIQLILLQYDLMIQYDKVVDILKYKSKVVTTGGVAIKRMSQLSIYSARTLHSHINQQG